MNYNKNDIEYEIVPIISIDQFEPKSGLDSEMIVVGFYLKNSEPALLLRNFLERSYISFVDTDVSPNPNEDGNYLVFIEFERNSGFAEKFNDIITEIENLTAKQDWKIQIYGSPDITYSLADDGWKNFLNLNLENNLPDQDSETKSDVKEGLSNFFSNVRLELMSEDNSTIAILEGVYLKYSGKKNISEGIIMYPTSPDHRISQLRKKVGNFYGVYQTDNFIVIENKLTGEQKIFNREI